MRQVLGLWSVTKNQWDAAKAQGPLRHSLTHCIALLTVDNLIKVGEVALEDGDEEIATDLSQSARLSPVSSRSTPGDTVSSERIML